MRFHLLALAALVPLAACMKPSSDREKTQEAKASTAPGSQFESLLFTDAASAGSATAAPANMAIEVNLARLGFSSGVIDGKATHFDELAIGAFQAANDLPESGRLDERTRTALTRQSHDEPTRFVRIPEGFARGPFFRDLPQATSEQAAYDRLGYRNLMEALAERFHTTPETLVELNSPGTAIGAGAVIRVPNIADVDTGALTADDSDWNRTLVTLGVSPRQPRADKVVVSRSAGTLRAYDEAGRLLAQFPATMGSEHDPLPLGTWKILGVSRNPEFHYNPKLFWDVSDSEESRLLPPGPNGPVGVVWIDLSKEHYGIHGTSEPASIGRSESHGCVRLTNWDAARLAQMVKPGVVAEFRK